MKIVKIEKPGFYAEGVLEGDDVRLIGGWREGSAREGGFSLPGRSLEELQGLARASSELVPLKLVTLAVPFSPLRQIIGIGLNYRAHAGESNNELPENPMIFTRSLDSLAAPNEPVERPRVSEQLDYEGEIAVVIGRGGRNIPVDQAMNHVFGYCPFMDGSVREYQRHTLTTGKNFRRSGSMGPWIATADEVGDAPLALEVRLNGEVMQSAQSSELLFSVAQLIEYISRWMLLQPGDVIATGTPSGVGSRRTPPRWLVPGDVVDVEIEGIGCLRNPVEDQD